MTPHENLVEDVAVAHANEMARCYGFSPLTLAERKRTGGWEHALKSAEVALAHILSRLHDVTPEMQGAAMMAWLDYDLPANVEYSDGQSINIWRAMLAASPLNGGKS